MKRLSIFASIILFSAAVQVAFAQTVPDRLVIVTGSQANDNLGDSLKTAFGKVNENFSRLWYAGFTNAAGLYDLSGVVDTNSARSRLGLDSSLNVKWLGVYGDGTNDDSVALQAVIDTAKRTGKDVFVPAGTYKLGRHIDLWTGVSIRGEGWPVIKRNFTLTGNCADGSYTGDRFLIQAWGKQEISGLIVDGNSQNFLIATNAVGDCQNSGYMDSLGRVNQTQYGEIAVADGAFDYGPGGEMIPLDDLNESSGNPGFSSVVIKNNIFRNACGSAIKNHEAGARKVLVFNNDFGEYYDHAVYFTGWSSLGGTNTPALDIQILNNRFSYPLQARGNTAIKLRNHTSRAIVSGNSFYLPFDAAFEVDAGDSNGSGDMNEVIIAENSGVAKRFLMLNGDSPSPAFHVQCIGNNMAIADYIFGGPFSTTFAIGGDVTLSNNKFRSTDTTKSILCLLRGDVETGCYFNITGNEIYGPVAFLTFGNIKGLNFAGNQLYNTRTPTNSDSLNVLFTPAGAGLVAGSAAWTIKGNYTWNYARLLYDDSGYSTNGGTNVLSAASVEFSENTMEGSAVINTPFQFAGTFNETNAHPNNVYLGRNRAEMVAPGVPLSSIQSATFEAPRTNAVVPALVLNNSAAFGTNVPSAGVVIRATRYRGTAVDGTNPQTIGEERFTHERSDTAGYGRWSIGLSGIGPTNTTDIADYAWLAPFGGQFNFLSMTNQYESNGISGGFGTSQAPWGYGAVWNVVHSQSGRTPFASDIGGSAVYWQFGQNAGSGADDTTFSFYNPVFGAAPLYRPVLLMASSGTVTAHGQLHAGYVHPMNMSASTVAITDGSTNLISVANAPGALVNDGSGGFSFRGIDATVDTLVSGGTTNRLVYVGGVLVSNIVNFYAP